MIDQETKELEKETEKLDKLRQKLKEEERLRHHLEATVEELKAKARDVRPWKGDAASD